MVADKQYSFFMHMRTQAASRWGAHELRKARSGPPNKQRTLPWSAHMASRLAHLELSEVEETGNVLGDGSYGVVVEMNVGGLK